MKIVSLFCILPFFISGCGEDPGGQASETSSSKASEIEVPSSWDQHTDPRPLAGIMIEQGLPVLIEYAKLLQQFEGGANQSSGSLVDLAFGAINTAQGIAIDAIPAQEGWQEKAGKRFHERLTGEVSLITTDKRLTRARSVLDKVRKANGLDHEFSLHLIKDKDLNAFASVGGYLYLTTGMIKSLASEDEMAWVLGHEIAHVTCGHCDRKAKTLHVAGGFGDIVETGANAGLMISAPFGQVDEYEADAKGRDYADEAGYDSEAGIEVLRRFMKKEGESNLLDKMISSHPFSQERITRLEK
ncbi:MAG: hypothetical protein CMH58_02860 [Myxococcales bacterium]|nr:hypothetical protein [Myxococcales bacterium]